MPDKLFTFDARAHRLSEGHADEQQIGQGIGQEAGRVPTAEDSLRVGLLIANAIAAAVYGPKGGHRQRKVS